MSRRTRFVKVVERPLVEKMSESKIWKHRSKVFAANSRCFAKRLKNFESSLNSRRLRVSRVTVQHFSQMLGLDRFVDHVRAAGLQCFSFDVAKRRHGDYRNEAIGFLVVNELGDG